MWQLKYGVNSDRELITISEVASGKTNLVCPFCGCEASRRHRPLTAKKGKIKQHHFAHTGETCLRVRKGKLPSLPLYDNFHLHLSGKHFQLLKDLWREYGNTDYAIITVPFELEIKKLFDWTPQGYYFTDLGKIPVGGLSLSKFNAVQEPLILSELDRLTNSVEMAKAIGGELLVEKLADLKIYQLQLRRILRFTLYFLEIKADGKVLHKIGVTSKTQGRSPRSSSSTTDNAFALCSDRSPEKVRYIGFTGHKDPLVHLRMLEIADQNNFRFDAVQMPLNVMDAHFRSFEREVLPVLVEKEIGVLGMKSMGDPYILQSKTVSPIECLHYVMNLPTSTVITGIEKMSILDRALEAVNTFEPMSEERINALLDRTRKAAETGNYELFKTTAEFDSTARNPEWLG